MKKKVKKPAILKRKLVNKKRHGKAYKKKVLRGENTIVSKK